MAYNPNSDIDRQMLADMIKKQLSDNGFARANVSKYGEHIWKRPVNGSIDLLVYTTIITDPNLNMDVVRRLGRDAIRVCAVYTNKKGERKGIARANKRVNRTGELRGIISRVQNQIKNVQAKAMSGYRCYKCKAPMAKSKAGKLYCADICWAK